MMQQQQQAKGEDKDESQKEGSPEEVQGPRSRPVVVVEGVLIPKMLETDRPMHEHVQLLKALEMREDDVVLMAYSKSGTHWIWEVTSMLVSGKAEYEKKTKLFSMMEFTTIDDLRALPSPRVFNSHFPFHLLPRQIKEKKVKIIHVYRNVKDVFVSMYFHYRQFPGAEAWTFDSLKNIFMAEKVPLGNYFTYMKDMYDYRKNNPDVPVFLMSFEDTKDDPEKVIGNLAKFLGVKASPELIKDIARLTSFDKMRHASTEKDQTKNQIPHKNVFRKGEVGDWKNHMTVAQSERFDAAATKLKSCDYNFRYSL